MSVSRLFLPLSLLALAGACVPSPAPAPPPSPAPPRPEPSQAPPSVVTPTYDNWMDAPQTPGDWFYSKTAQGSTARFGAPQSEARFSVVCDRARSTVSLVRSASSPVAVPMRVRTETADRVLSAEPQGGQLPTLVATLPARDSFLDAMAFSRGRFAVEISGVPTLYLPAWPEISRVVEDCR